jgi:transcriptional regulator with XRE-family HTH domain
MCDSRVVADHFGENLVIQRRRARLSQEEVAFRASLHRTEIGILERGLRLARIDTVVKLAGALEIDAGLLFDGLAWTAGSNIVGGFSAPSGEPRQRRGRVD